MTLFHMPDLGEGLTEAEIVEWHVREGDTIQAEQPLVSVETAKAIVEVPSPESGRVGRLYGRPGEVLRTGDPLVEFHTEAEAPRPDAGSVVGEVKTGGGRAPEDTTTRPGVQATPAVRALARRLEVDLSIVTPSGPEQRVTAADVQRVRRILDEVGPIQPLTGVRRAMARVMSQAHAEVVAVTVSDDADIQAWGPEADLTVRLIQAIVAACRAEPSLNAWYDAHAVGRRVLARIDLGIAVDTEDGLFVPVLRDVAGRDAARLRADLNETKQAVRERRLPPEALRGQSFTLSNFGTFAGRYADPVVVPPSVAILGAGKVREAVVVERGAPAVHRILPLSLSFDHRAVTGGEAARFLGAVMAHLARP